FVEQPRVLNGDDGLACEALNQLDLFFGERPNLPPIDGDGSHKSPLLEHRDREKRPSAGGLNEWDQPRIAFEKSLLGCQIRDVSDCVGLGKPRERGASNIAERKHWLASKLRKTPGGRFHQGRVECIILEKEQITKLGLTNSHCLVQHGVEDRVEVSRRA